jgi:beta-phosphoglucomutase family hydrolase
MYGLIFDMDGVLVDSARPHWHSWQRLADEIGQPMTESQFQAVFGRHNRDIIPLIFGVDDEASIQRLADRKEVLYRELIRDRIPAIDGAAELVAACHDAGLSLAIGSSGPPENVNLVLDGMRIADYFPVRITARQVTRGKPDPQVFLLAAEGLGLPPDRCAVVEDAPSGIEAARAAGTAAIGLAGTHPPESLHHAHRVVMSLREIGPADIEELIRGNQA